MSDKTKSCFAALSSLKSKKRKPIKHRNRNKRFLKTISALYDGICAALLRCYTTISHTQITTKQNQNQTKTGCRTNLKSSRTMHDRSSIRIKLTIARMISSARRKNYADEFTYTDKPYSNRSIVLLIQAITMNSGKK